MFGDFCLNDARRPPLNTGPVMNFSDQGTASSGSDHYQAAQSQTAQYDDLCHVWRNWDERANSHLIYDVSKHSLKLDANSNEKQVADKCCKVVDGPRPRTSSSAPGASVNSAAPVLDSAAPANNAAPARSSTRNEKTDCCSCS
ncbi:unnamed protein product [Amoebophrya sp. A120]|nr:unnamed protein product [Amoebophrya sp. A120]|eukprot:GSA120T00007197001.1